MARLFLASLTNDVCSVNDFVYVIQICVWCWHHIVDMAEKDQIEGRCPACRTPYDKEKIVGMTVDCDRLL